MILTFIWIGILSFLIFPNLMWASVVLVLCGCGVVYAVINILFNMVHRNTDSPQSYCGVRRRGISEFGCFADVVMQSSKESWFEGIMAASAGWSEGLSTTNAQYKGSSSQLSGVSRHVRKGREIEKGRWRGGGMPGGRAGERELWNTHGGVKEFMNG